jgi:hypothetical protein
VKVALPAPLVRMSTIAPPGLPLAGSLLLPMGGKRKFGSFEMKTSFSLPDDEIFRINLTPLIGWSTAWATTAMPSVAPRASPIPVRRVADIFAPPARSVGG